MNANNDVIFEREEERRSGIFLSISCVELVMRKIEGMMIGSTIGELLKLSFSDFHGKSNYGHLQISGAPNSRDHRLETTPPDDTIYSVSPILDGGPWLVSFSLFPTTTDQLETREGPDLPPSNFKEKISKRNGFL